MFPSAVYLCTVSKLSNALICLMPKAILLLLPLQETKAHSTRVTSSSFLEVLYADINL